MFSGFAQNAEQLTNQTDAKRQTNKQVNGIQIFHIVQMQLLSFSTCLVKRIMQTEANIMNQDISYNSISLTTKLLYSGVGFINMAYNTFLKLP